MAGDSLQYRGLGAEVRFIRDRSMYAGRVLVADAIVNFTSPDAAGVEPAFHAAVDAYMDALARREHEPRRIDPRAAIELVAGSNPVPPPLVDGPWWTRP